MLLNKQNVTNVGALRAQSLKKSQENENGIFLTPPPQSKAWIDASDSGMPRKLNEAFQQSYGELVLTWKTAIKKIHCHSA